ncbi:AAA family ATPase [Kribbella sp. NPDC058245]|uniref:AAA family ATPase n=1 Tax=Kribbella sp. NPDC058245 TaxID=3346399 RepID=UPI0036E47668
MVTAPVHIAITGTHSTGKTVLMRRAEMELRAIGLRVARVHGLGKRAAAIGLPKMQRHTAISTEWVIATGIADELERTTDADVVLTDRAPIDALAYYTAALEFRGEVSEPATIERLEQLVASQSPRYELLLATELDLAEPVQATHDYDPRYRHLVDRHVHDWLFRTSSSHQLVANTDDSRDNAIALIKCRVALLEDSTT